jgi:hypothetical protein
LSIFTKKQVKNKVIRHVKKALILSDRGPLKRELKNNEFLMPSAPQKARESLRPCQNFNAYFSDTHATSLSVKCEHKPHPVVIRRL